MTRIDENSEYKVYTDVIDLVDDEGRHRPLFFRWLDDTWKKVYRIVEVDHQHSNRGGGVGVRYVVEAVWMEDDKPRRITTNMWLEEDKWFMER